MSAWRHRVADQPVVRRRARRRPVEFGQRALDLRRGSATATARCASPRAGTCVRARSGSPLSIAPVASAMQPLRVAARRAGGRQQRAFAADRVVEVVEDHRGLDQHFAVVAAPAPARGRAGCTRGCGRSRGRPTRRDARTACRSSAMRDRHAARVRASRTCRSGSCGARSFRCFTPLAQAREAELLALRVVGLAPPPATACARAGCSAGVRSRDRAARIEQVEAVRGLADLLVGGQRQAELRPASALRLRRRRSGGTVRPRSACSKLYALCSTSFWW